MLEKPIMFFGIVVFMFFVFAGGIVLFVGVSKWYQLQAETQFIAATVAEYGGYTDVADSAIAGFAAAKNFNPAQLTVSITPPGGYPVNYGNTLSVSMSYPFSQVVRFGNMSYLVFPVNFQLKTYAAALSTYVPQMGPGSPLQAAYTTPSFP
ncbi:MAG: hypothetical protein M0Z41_19620 [Peptococcaceae bacterium]|jgi:hypothetical protein|nr:hypothetical protein [Peptococcaceae bacterium]